MTTAMEFGDNLSINDLDGERAHLYCKLNRLSYNLRLALSDQRVTNIHDNLGIAIHTDVK